MQLVSAPQRQPDTTLHHRLGGADGVERLLVTFYGLVLADPLLAPFFKDVPMDKLLRMQQELFSASLGGPHTYSGRPLRAVHAGRGIGQPHFHRFRQPLLTTLQHAGADAEDIREVVRRVSAVRKDVLD